jgi:hypothetical protein
MKMIEDSGLMDALEVIKFNILASQKQADLFRQLVSLYPKTETLHIHYSFNDDDLATIPTTSADRYIGEQPTLRRMWDDAKTEDFYGLYFHNKGSTAFPNMFKNSRDIQQFKNYHYWRKYLEWGCIEKWRDCVEALQTHDTAGVGYNKTPVPHYSGNFWWTKSEYLHKLDDIYNSDWWKNTGRGVWQERIISEFWPLSAAQNTYSVHYPPDELCDPNPGLYSVTYHRKIYEN